MHDCGNGFFVASGDSLASSDILVEANDIFDNGNSGGIYEHNNYTAAPLEVWRHATFGLASTDPLVAGDTADPDGDGAVNFEEFALATDALLGSARPSSTVGLAGGFLTLTYSRPDPPPPEVAYETEASSDLATWCGECTFPSGAPRLANGTATVTVRDSIPTSMASKRFLRLRLRR